MPTNTSTFSGHLSHNLKQATTPNTYITNRLPRLLVLFIFTASIGLPLSTSAIELVPHKAGYNAKVKKGISLNGDAIRELKQLPSGQWSYRFDVGSFVADIKESVIFEWTDNRVMPINYDYELSGMFIKDRIQKVQFNWPELTASGRDRKNKWNINIPKNSLDRIGYQLQLLLDVNAGKTHMNYDIIHKGSVRPSEFQVVREEKIDSILGQVDSIVIEKVREPSKKRKTHLWFAKDHKFLLLKMVQIEDDGERYEINLKWAEINGKRL